MSGVGGMVRSNASWEIGHMVFPPPPPPCGQNDRQIDTTENINFPQLRWRTVIVPVRVDVALFLFHCHWFTDGFRRKNLSIVQVIQFHKQRAKRWRQRKMLQLSNGLFTVPDPDSSLQILIP